MKDLLNTTQTFKNVGELIDFLSNFKDETPLFTDRVAYSGAVANVRIHFTSLKNDVYEDDCYIPDFETDSVYMCLACGY